MRIEQNTLVTVTKSARQTCKAATPDSGRAFPSFEETGDLRQALSDAADVRAEKVARGKALIADPNYPSKAQMKTIADLLAKSLSNDDSLNTPATASHSTMPKSLANALISTCA
jgi:hypothetical protein